MDYIELQKEATAIRKDIHTACTLITDAKMRYIKSRLRLRGKKQAAGDDLFKELSGYNSRWDIQDAYGYDVISESEMDRLMDLWELREAHQTSSGRFNDRVTEMLDHAMSRCGDGFSDVLDEFDEVERERRAIEREIL